MLGVGLLPEEQHDKPHIPATTGSDFRTDHILEGALSSPPTLCSMASVSEVSSGTPDLLTNLISVDGRSTEGNPELGTARAIEPLAVLLGNTPSSDLVFSGEGSIHPTSYCAESWLEPRHLEQHIPCPWGPENAYAEKLNRTGQFPWASKNTVTDPVVDHVYHNDSARSSEALNSHQLTITSDVLGSHMDCYVILLSYLAQLESSLALQSPRHPIPIDFTLRADSDLRKLKERIFTCQGHGTSDTMEAGAGNSVSCMASPRPVLLVLCLLAERVVHALEDLFRRATVLVHPVGETSQVSSYPNAKRTDRTLRSLLDYTSTCAFPEANRQLYIGSFEVYEEVKTRSLRRILRGRMYRLLDMIGDMKRVIGSRRKEILRSQAQGYVLGLNENSAGTNEAQGNSVDQLYLRVESLLGRVHLTG
ncbi:hypothetical protein TruAng_001894 [Truncatella angustata]|nr:hypothetical protein TruAng_001894 [Truncatella angustata]